MPAELTPAEALECLDKHFGFHWESDEDAERFSDCLAVLRAAVEDAERNAWRPIETAVKNGSYGAPYLRLWIPGFGEHRGKWSDDENSNKPKPCWNWNCFQGKAVQRLSQPTHWRPEETGPAIYAARTPAPGERT